MSGIYGIINLKNHPVEQQQMDALELNMIHRGVDGKAQWLDNHVGLGHLKLEITPESTYENLPLTYKQWVITADARIDNRDELDGLLSISEAERPFTPDSTYIVRAYEKWREDCVKHLIGDFAFAIWDTVEKRLFCARDHIGIKPFFYLKTDEKFIFASEIKAIVELRVISIELDESKFGDYMYRIHDWHNPTNTLFKNIQRLLPGHYGLLQINEFESKRYWRLEQRAVLKLPNEEAYSSELRKLMIQAVECRMRTPFEVGVTLSGGLDSSSVACIAARKLAKQNKYLYSASSVLPEDWKGFEEDERFYVETVLKQEKNIIPSYVSAEKVRLFEDLDKFFNQMYLPVNPFYYMDAALDAAFKKNSEIRVKLNGFCGDIAVSNKGNLVFQTLLRQLRIRTLIKLIVLRSRIEGKFISQKLIKELITYFVPRKLINFYKRFKKTDKIGNNAFSLMTQDSFKKEFRLDTLYKELSAKMSNSKTFSDSVRLDLDGIIGALEEINNRNAHIGIEELTPLADIRVLDFMVNISPEFLMYKGWARGLIRSSMEGIIPPEVQKRKDKTMYSPDYFRRVVNDERYIKSQLRQIKSYSTIEKYINVANLKHYLSTTKLVKNWDDPKFDNSSVIFTLGFIYLKFIEFFSNHILNNININRNEKTGNY